MALLREGGQPVDPLGLPQVERVLQFGQVEADHPEPRRRDRQHVLGRTLLALALDAAIDATEVVVLGDPGEKTTAGSRRHPEL